MTGGEGAVPYLWMAVVRFRVEGKRGVSGGERASPQGSGDAILSVLQKGCPPKSDELSKRNLSFFSGNVIVSVLQQRYPPKSNEDLPKSNKESNRNSPFFSGEAILSV
ncbi:hypothetical protein MRB53_016060 [Persea americana]|uniref:Uncharacterized protein n=1 Tax=Persea americana TaxID=3435 RepID=A0ACC2M210_PERAE|nr:hypothetical protein MRB53_016060 [Persea americana]